MVTQHGNLRKHAVAAAAIILGLAPATPLPAQIALVDYAALAGTEFISFDAVAGGPGAGTHYDGILAVDGVAFGERFDGQTLSAAGHFDQLGGAPSGGLTLLAGEANHNLAFFQSPAGKVLSGVGTAGFPSSDAIGEGAVALMFSSGQSEFGFRLAGGHGGNAHLSFFGGDGGLIQSIALSSLPLTAAYGFTRNGGVADIRGISIWNDDPTGFGLAGLRHDFRSAVPEPATWAMMILGFGAIGAAMRRGTGRRRLPMALRG